MILPFILPVHLKDFLDLNYGILILDQLTYKIHPRINLHPDSVHMRAPQPKYHTLPHSRDELFRSDVVPSSALKNYPRVDH